MSTATITAPLDPTWPAAAMKKIDDCCKLNGPDDDLAVDGATLLEHICHFIGRYLECSEHQRTIMALWVLHTYGLSAAQVTPYLSIRSSEKHSGKTLCLQLLNMLIKDQALSTGFTASAITRRMDPSIPTILLDECEATVGTRGRPKSPMLRAILASGYHCGPGYTDATHERNVFAPKAFAGIGSLPEALADRSISIILEPLKDRTKIQRYDHRRAWKEAEPLRKLLDAWSEYNRLELEEMHSYSYADLPSDLPPRTLDIMEPFLRLAEMVGGPWPHRIHEALAVAFKKTAEFDLQQSVELLADIRDCFAFHNYPERLASAVFLDWLHSLPPRPWDVNGPISARKFANLLAPFAIHPRFQRMGKESSARGYQLHDFLPLWQKHLAFDAASVAHATESQIPNKDAGCSAVADSRADSEISAVTQGPTAKAEGLIDEPDSWLPPILMPSDSACYNYGPHSDWDVKIIRHFAAQGYKALSEMEARRIEFSCGNLPFGTMTPRTSLAYPEKPVRSVRRAEPPMTEEERAAVMEKIRRDREAPPKCAERENFRIAPTKGR